MERPPALPLFSFRFKLCYSVIVTRRLVILFFSAILFSACSKEFTATVVSVSDGDTLVVQEGSGRKKIRLYGIDCPEGNQPFGNEARKFTAELVAARTVRIEALYNDPHDRIVAKVYLPDERYVNAEIVTAGYAWWFRRYAENDELLKNSEREAKSARRGLWRDPNPTAPWNFRQEQR